MILLKTSHMQYYWQLMRADKPVGIYLLLWPTLWGVFLAADGMPSLDILFIFIAGVVIMRSAGCVINDFADRRVDGAVERTKNRPLAAGIVSAKEALQLFALLIFFAFILVLFLGLNTLLLSIAALALASIYPFMKRYTHLPQVVLGAAFAWSIPMAFMAITNELPHWIWLLYLANVLWTVAYDTQYAMVDRRDDVKVGIKSSAILFGKYDLLVITMLQVSTLVLLAFVFYINSLSLYAYGSLLLCAVLFLYQLNLCKRREAPKCFSAFLHNNWVGMTITAGIVVGLFFS
jgi:4-hydroxybenzoate polyprenyltransferase